MKMSKAKYKTGSPLDLGLSSQSVISGGSRAKLRGETSEATQRPVSSSESISSDRGTFKSR